MRFNGNFTVIELTFSSIIATYRYTLLYIHYILSNCPAFRGTVLIFGQIFATVLA